MENGKWRMENGKCEMENEKRETRNQKPETRNEKLLSPQFLYQFRAAVNLQFAVDIFDMLPDGIS
jgi:hypothetical protein